MVMVFKRKRIVWQRLTRDDTADIEHEVGEPRQARALGMEMPEFEARPFALVAERVVSSPHSLTQENCWRRQCLP